MTHDFAEDPLRTATDLQSPERPGDYLRGQAEFMLGMANLIDVLGVHTEPERIQYDFIFSAALGIEAQIPSSIARYSGTDIEYIKISLIKETETHHTASLEIRSPGKTLFISRDPDINSGVLPRDVPIKYPVVRSILRPDEMIDLDDNSSVDEDVIQLDGSYSPDDPTGTRGTYPIDRIPREDINALVMELIAGRRIHDQAGLQNADVFSAEAYTTLLGALQQTAHNWDTHPMYEQEGDPSVQWSTTSFGNGEHIAAAHFIYPTATLGRFVVANINPHPFGIALDFELRDESGGTFPFSADTGDILRLQEVMAGLLAKHDTIVETPLHPDEIDKLVNDLPPDLDFPND